MHGAGGSKINSAMHLLAYVIGMFASFIAAFLFAYPAALRWDEEGFNAISAMLFLPSLLFVIACLLCSDRIIKCLVPERRRGFPVVPINEGREEEFRLGHDSKWSRRDGQN